ncbi:M23 family metallopeptidase [Cohnella sp. REN36]|uniref:M23 family metallopeptidase n=1 Tax=Cohnella sp. REN36 TaxID=2887347 RepID=UPI001D134D44|nr:M23 family metallopeptidase [Cohnella sp. REN36]MCC3376912.1 M23 family metallopeptidase [Cohnella sp. REN36]
MPMRKNARGQDPRRAPTSAGGAARQNGLGTRAPAPEENDPELWWKERQRLQRENGGDWGRIGGIGGSYAGGRSPGEAAPRSFEETGSPYSAHYPSAGGASASDSGGGGAAGGRPPLGPWYGETPGRNGPSPGWGDDGAWPDPIRRLARGFAIRSVVALLVFAGVWGWFRLELPGSDEAQTWVAQAVTRDMDFAAVEAWYAKTFGGSPSFLPAFRHNSDAEAVSAQWSREETVPPIDGRVVETFAQSKSGVRLAAVAGTPVVAVHTGRVTQVTTGDNGLATILVQHTNRVVTVYGNVSEPAVQPNDWVEAGQTLGALARASDSPGGEGWLLFAVKQNGKTLDPAEVVPFD